MVLPIFVLGPDDHCGVSYQRVNFENTMQLFGGGLVLRGIHYVLD
jgi:hypothetical protein